ncbi:unnamed protein product [Triticum aestivum]|uniref:Uncharacterized protein n=5 Tax=Triticinae TaxID=1648030 RepID=A0A9R1ETE0_WHEAT|nr:hypothetical protein CFC21_029548 [Triticum aestivum]SPT17806.1 unnamed protein product [Triticum aestivum]
MGLSSSISMFFFYRSYVAVKDAENMDWMTQLQMAMGIAYCQEHMLKLNLPARLRNLISTVMLQRCQILMSGMAPRDLILSLMIASCYISLCISMASCLS